jgi:beta-lactamase regulating signal transducer with metallopeptidase domain
MVLPPLPERLSEAAPTPLAQASQSLASFVVEPLGVPAAEVAAGAPSLWPWVLAAWVAGAAGFIGYHLVAHGRFTRRVRRLARSVRIVANGKVEVIETDAATGPLAFGVMRKYVAFPRDFVERYDPLERDLALAHELGHHARGDLIANWFALVVLAAHWFNPIAWRSFRAFRADQEMACDALVLAGRAQGLRLAYGRAIVKSAHGGAVSAACHLHTINELKGRLRMLNANQSKSRARLLTGVVALTALTVGGLGLTASGTQAAERVRTKVSKTIGLDVAKLEMPAFPNIPAFQDAPPAPPVPGDLPARADGGKTKRVVIVKDGKATNYEGANAEAYIAENGLPVPPIPPRALGASPAAVVMIDKDGAVANLHARHPLPPGSTMKRRFTFRDDDGKLTAMEDGAGVHTFHTRTDKRVARHGPDGKLTTFDYSRAPMPPEALAALRNMPEITSRDCTGNGANAIETRDGAKRRIVICTDRIARAARAASHASIDTARIERDAHRSALQGLRAARRSIEDNASMSDTQRSAALEGIDEAIREMAHKSND